MPTMIFIAHLPLLRIDIEEEACPFGYGKLWRLPFERYDQITLGAFSDHRAAYDATAPVFFYFELDHDWPNLIPGREGVEGIAQLKFPSHDWSLLGRFGLGFLSTVMETFVEPAWAALSLAAPAAGLPAPRLSALFAIPDGDFSLDFSGQRMAGAQIQGDADQEFLFMPEAAARALSESDLARAEQILGLVYGLRPDGKGDPNPRSLHPEIQAGLDMLLAAAAPSLTAPERLTLSVTALEALLLPEMMSGLRAAFSLRLSGLCGADEAHRQALAKIARKLYDYRSANIHGGSGGDGSRTLALAQPQQILAAAILAAAENGRAGQPPEQLRAALDAQSGGFNPAAAGLPLADPPGLRQGETLLLPRSPVVVGFASGADMSTEEERLLSWSPLVGLALENIEDQPRGLAAGVGLYPLSAEELLSMEDRDVRRDFAAETRMTEYSHSVLAVMTLSDGDPYTLPDLAVQPLLRWRDLAVTALRMAGCRHFIDPELLGWYLYHAKARIRRPTIYRQSILIDFRKEPEDLLKDADLDRTGAHLELLAAYNQQARDESVEHVLRLYRRGFDRRFLPGAGRAGLMLACLEATLGRFRKREDPVQLENLVAAAAGPAAPANALDWFQSAGRKFRNAVAHGYWQPAPGTADEPLEHLLDLLSALVPLFVRAWVELPERGRRTPEAVFTAAARAALK